MNHRLLRRSGTPVATESDSLQCIDTVLAYMSQGWVTLAGAECLQTRANHAGLRLLALAIGLWSLTMAHKFWHSPQVHQANKDGQEEVLWGGKADRWHRMEVRW